MPSCPQSPGRGNRNGDEWGKKDKVPGSKREREREKCRPVMGLVFCFAGASFLLLFYASPPATLCTRRQAKKIALSPTLTGMSEHVNCAVPQVSLSLFSWLSHFVLSAHLSLSFQSLSDSLSVYGVADSRRINKHSHSSRLSNLSLERGLFIPSSSHFHFDCRSLRSPCTMSLSLVGILSSSMRPDNVEAY